EFVYPREILATEQRIYLALVFSTISVGYICSYYLNKKMNFKYFYGILTIIFILFINANFQRATIYRNSTSIMEDLLKKRLADVSASAYLAQDKAMQNDWTAALFLSTQALE